METVSDTSSMASILIQGSTGGPNSAEKNYKEYFVRHGYGINLWKSGAVYEGEWDNNRTHGKGIFWHSKGDIYIGQFDTDQAHGFGVYIHVNGSRYEG